AGAVDHREPDRLLEVALLARSQLVVTGDQVRVAGFGGRLDLGDLPRSQVGVRVRAVAALEHFPDHRNAGGAKQLAELRQVVAVLERADAEGALHSPLRGRRSIP